MKFLHVTIQTKAFEEEMKFYQEIVGLKIVNDLRPMGTEIVFFANAEGETCVEVINSPDADASVNQFRSIGFATDDVEALRTDLESKGLNPTPMISPNPHTKFFFVTDPAGVRVQFM